ncbi:MAG TPA: ABC transporter permease [Segeticoccus sp.]|uniref:ABC transporter permease n=1 Tax=Segeticoccus sp. TaxID=2706531 RepID=UPI002D7E72DC|nr:ABC transporter permease [Segeticoccus sp.]HET8598683.1 ABC transporter permease [Segeticoccus sp.]
MTATAVEMESEETLATQVSTDRPSLLRLVGQPLACLAVVVGALVYVRVADVSVPEQRQLGTANLLTLLGQHLLISVIATALVCLLAVPTGVLLTRGSARRFSKPIITVAGFGQAAPAIGLIALGAVVFGIGKFGAIAALTVYGLLPIIANTVAGLDSVDRRLVEAARGMGMTGTATLLRVELPLALPVIIAGMRTALVLIVGTATLATFTGAGGLGSLITVGITLQEHTVLVVGAILVAALALFIDWLARLVEIYAAAREGS